MSDIFTETIYRVWNDQENVFIEISPCEEGQAIQVATTTQLSKDFFGPINFRIYDKNLAIQIAEALLKAAEKM